MARKLSVCIVLILLTTTNCSPPTENRRSQPPADIPTVLVSSGSFEMGNNHGKPDEQPVHTVTLDAFYIDKYEVTNAQYAACVDAGVCDPPSRTDSETRTSYYGNPQYDDYPVIGVNWFAAQIYCEWRGGRLPTEAEWEKAARGPDGRLYPWGDDFDPNRLNYCDLNCDGIPWADLEHNDGYADTAPVGSYVNGVSPYSAYDMAGNVWEWVGDWYDPDYYSISPTENPLGPSSGEQRVMRGGGIFEEPYYTRTTKRRQFTPDVWSTSVGIRCAY